MESAAPPRTATPIKFRLLAIILTVLTILPLAVFAVDAPNRAPVRAAREALVGRAPTTTEDPTRREERSRASRARRRPTVGSAIGAMLLELFWVCIAAWVGRRIFTVRL